MSSTIEMVLEVIDELQLVRGARPVDLQALVEEAAGSSETFLQSLRHRSLVTDWQHERLLGGRFDELRLGRYIVLEPIGEGGMGRVFKARHALMNRIVAVKIIREDVLGHSRVVDRFRREIELAARLHHPHIVTAFDAEEVEGRLLFVMEFAPGDNLAHLIRRRGPLPLPLACEYHRQAASALHHAHEHGLVHRDVKPGNFLVHENHSKVLDLGLACLRFGEADPTEAGAESLLTSEGVIMGTVDFMAPEQANDLRSADARSDIYSLGCSLFFTLTGRVPYPGGTPLEKVLRHRVDPSPVLVEHLEGAPEELGRIVSRMMAKERVDRFESMAEVAEVLAPFKSVEDVGSALDTDQLGAANPAAPTMSARTTPWLGDSGAPSSKNVEPHSTSRVLESSENEADVPRRSWLWWCLGGVLLATLSWGVYELSTNGPESSTPSPSSRSGPIRRLVLERKFPSREGEPNDNPTPVMQLAFSSDDKIILAGGGLYAERLFGPGSIARWDVTTGKPLSVLRGHEAPVRAMGLSSDGRLFVSAEGPLNREPGIPGKVILWDTRTWAKRSEFIAQPGGVTDLAFADGLLVVGGPGPTLRWFDLSKNPPSLVRELDTKTAELISFAFSQDGDHLVTGHSDRTVKLWNAKTRALLGVLPNEPGKGWVSDLCFSRDGGKVVAVTNHYGLEGPCPPPEILQWNVASKQLIRATPHPDGWNFFAVRYAPDGSTILTTEANGASLWDSHTAERLAHFHPCENFVFAVSLSDKFVVTSDDSSRLHLWRIEPE